MLKGVAQKGQGDGNGVIAGFYNGNSYGFIPSGEPLMLWVDLSVAGLIDGGFSTATPTNYLASTTTDLAVIGKYYPKAKIADNLFVYVANNSSSAGYVNKNPRYANSNFFTISQVNEITNFGGSFTLNQGEKGISVNKAYSIDAKIDDGLPISGKVITLSPWGGGFFLFSNGDVDTTNTSAMPSSSSINPSATTCYDNANNSANPVIAINE